MKDSPTYQCLRILLIEDNPNDALQIRTALSALRDESFPAFELVHVIHASRLSAALQRLTKGGIDVILAGLSLPDSHWTPACRTLRKHAPNVPMVVLTKRENELFELTVKRDGIEECLSKDRLDGSVLSRTLHRELERQHVRTTLNRLEHDTRASEARKMTSTPA